MSESPAEEPGHLPQESLDILENLSPHEILFLIDFKIYMTTLILMRLWKLKHPESNEDDTL